MKTLRNLALLALATMLCACATYRYTRTEPTGVSCSLEVKSARKVTGPVSFQLTVCDAIVNLGSLSSPLEQLGAQVVGAVMPALIQQRVAPPIPAQTAPAATVEPPK